MAFWSLSSEELRTCVFWNAMEIFQVFWANSMNNVNACKLVIMILNMRLLFHNFRGLCHYEIPSLAQSMAHWSYLVNVCSGNTIGSPPPGQLRTKHYSHTHLWMALIFSCFLNLLWNYTYMYRCTQIWICIDVPRRKPTSFYQVEFIF